MFGQKFYFKINFVIVTGKETWLSVDIRRLFDF